VYIVEIRSKLIYVVCGGYLFIRVSAFTTALVSNNEDDELLRKDINC